MDNKIAVQRLFRGILLRNASASEEKLFAEFLDNRKITVEQLAVVGWQSSDFLSKVAPIALMDYAMSGIVNGERVIGWYNSPSGTPLAPTGTDSTLIATQILVSGYGLSSTRDAVSLAGGLHQFAQRLGILITSSDARSYADMVLNGQIRLADLCLHAVKLAIDNNPKLVELVATGLLQSVLSEGTVVPFGSRDILVEQAESITDRFLAPSVTGGAALVAYEAGANDGSIDPLSIHLTGVAWRGKVGDTILKLTGLPVGLSGKVVITDSQTAEIQFSGKARSHQEAASTTVSLLFSDAHFLGAKAVDVEPLVKGVLSVSLQFFDNVPWTVSGNQLSVFGTEATTIDLAADTGSVGAMTIPAANLAGVTKVDVRAVSGAQVTLSGDGAANVFYANAAGSVIRGRDGDDTFYAGKGKDTFIFEAVTTPGTAGIVANGMDTIHDFKIGEGGDVLDFTAFLGKPSFPGTAVSAAGVGYVWGNGEIVTVYENGSALSTPADIAGLFGAALAPPPAAPPAASSPGKLVVITAGVPAPGDPGVASVWFVSNRSAAGNVAQIEASEVIKVAELIGINNLGLLSLHADNIVV